MAQETPKIDVSWQTLLARLEKRVGRAAFCSWIKPLSLEQQTPDGVLVLRVPTKFVLDWVQSKYLSVITSLAKEVFKDCTDVRLDLSDGLGFRDGDEAQINNEQATPLADNVTLFPLNKPAASSPLLDPEYEIKRALNPKYKFDDFVVGPPNEFAFAAARRVAESDVLSFNPLFLYGGVGLGKTHLMHAIAWDIMEKTPHRRVIYMSAEKFMYQFIKALRSKDTVSFKEQFRSVDVLMIDDIQFIAGKESTQEEFFHTFNALVEQRRQIILSADKSPSDIEGLGDRLKSRMASGLVADLHPTTYELRLSVLQSKVERSGNEISDKVLAFLAQKITSNIRELEGALNCLLAHANLVGKEVTIDFCRDVLKDLLRSHTKTINIDDIQHKVADYFGIRVSEMQSSRRARAFVRPRQIAMYLCRELTSASYPDIGDKFGGRDHTTVLHAIKTIEKLMLDDTNFQETVQLLNRSLDS